MRLLYKAEQSVSSSIFPEAVKEEVSLDINMKKLAALLSINNDIPQDADRLMSLTTSNSDDIIRRQQICRDLYDNKELFDDMKSVYEQLLLLKAIADDRSSVTDKNLNNHVIVVNWLYHYCKAYLFIDDVFSRHSGSISANALIEMKSIVSKTVTSEEFQTIAGNIKKLKEPVSSIKSIKMGVNLNEYYEPVSINCLETEKEYYQPKKVLDVSLSTKEVKYCYGKLRYIPKGRIREGNARYDQGLAPTVLASSTRLQRFTTCKIDIGFIRSVDSFFKTLNFNNRISVRNFIVDKASEIFEAVEDLEFILGGVKLANTLTEKGMPVCLASPAESEKGQYSVKDLYNCYLPFIINNPAESVVKNDLELHNNSSFAILNGPNKGGKTTFIQAMALNTILFQLGLFSTCKKATISPVNSLITHYQRDESGTLAGRLENEMKQIRTIFQNISSNSLVFFNEPYVSTSPAEGMGLILDVLKAIIAVKSRGLLVTHYHQINDTIDEMNAQSKNNIVFLNMGIEADEGNHQRTYELRKGKGEVKSFAEDILREYAPEILKN